MKRLLLFRHGKSSWKDLGLDDHDRPLKKRGKRDARRAGGWLDEQRLLPDVVLTSTAARARATARRALEALGTSGDPQAVPELYLAEPARIVEVLRTLGKDAACALVVGHSPGLDELASLLSGRPVRLQTAAVAWIDLPIDAWEELRVDTRGVLLSTWRP